MDDISQPTDSALKSIPLRDIAELVGADLPFPAAAQIPITGVASLTQACNSEISFLGSGIYAKHLPTTRAAAVLVQRDVEIPGDSKTPLLLVDNADLAIAKALDLFALPIPRPPAGIDPLCHIDPSARLGPNVAIGPFCFIGRNVRLGAGCIIHPGVYIGDDSLLGESCEVFPSATIRERVTVGARVIIHAGAVIGSDGFGYRWDGSKHAKIPQIGTVVIEDDVEIGSCACIDRAKFGATRIGRGTKIDNLVQIAHNVQLAPHCILAAQVGIAGTTTIGVASVFGGQTGVRDHLTIGEQVTIAACAAVAQDVPSKSTLVGVPAIPHRQFFKQQAALARLPDLLVQFRKMQEELRRLQAIVEGNSKPTEKP